MPSGSLITRTAPPPVPPASLHSTSEFRDIVPPWTSTATAQRAHDWRNDDEHFPSPHEYLVIECATVYRTSNGHVPEFSDLLVATQR